jgi:hypothetical protein
MAYSRTLAHINAPSRVAARAAFASALAGWAVAKWQPQGRHQGEFDAVTVAGEARYGVNDELAAALDLMRPRKRLKRGPRRGWVRHAAVAAALDEMARRGLLIKTSHLDGGWFDIPNPEPVYWPDDTEFDYYGFDIDRDQVRS